MAKGPEAKLQAWAISYALSFGVLSIRLYFAPGMSVGWPDVIFLIPGGRPLFIEFKAPGKKPTERQKHKIKLLKGQGYDVEVIDSKSKAKQVIDDRLGRVGIPT